MYDTTQVMLSGTAVPSIWIILASFGEFYSQHLESSNVLATALLILTLVPLLLVLLAAFGECYCTRHITADTDAGVPSGCAQPYTSLLCSVHYKSQRTPIYSAPSSGSDYVLNFE